MGVGPNLEKVTLMKCDGFFICRISLQFQIAVISSDLLSLL